MKTIIIAAALVMSLSGCFSKQIEGSNTQIGLFDYDDQCIQMWDVQIVDGRKEYYCVENCGC